MQLATAAFHVLSAQDHLAGSVLPSTPAGMTRILVQLLHRIHDSPARSLYSPLALGDALGMLPAGGAGDVANTDSL